MEQLAIPSKHYTTGCTEDGGMGGDVALDLDAHSTNAHTANNRPNQGYRDSLVRSGAAVAGCLWT